MPRRRGHKEEHPSFPFNWLTATLFNVLSLNMKKGGRQCLVQGCTVVTTFVHLSPY